MRCTDTDSKGKSIFQTRQGTYVGMTVEEMEETLIVIAETIQHRREGKPREFIDSRQKKNY